MRYTHSYTKSRGRASGRLPFQARDLERRYGSVSSLAGAFEENGCGVSGSKKGLEQRRANGDAYDSLEGKVSLVRDSIE